MRRQCALQPWTLLALLLVLGCGDDPLPRPTDPSAPVLTGIVTNSVNGDPVVGAVVRLGDAAVTTGAGGRYKLDDLTPGVDTLRCEAPGYVDLKAGVTVKPGTVHLDIALTRIEVFELGDFALYVPAGVNFPRGILLALGGPNTKAFSTGEPFGAPLPEVEASLQALGEAFRTMAAQRELAILGTSLIAMTNGPESDQLIEDAVHAAAEASGRFRLSEVPILMYGLSGGAPQASGFTARHSERVAGLVLKVPASVTALTSGAPLRVPTFMILAELDAFVDNAALKESFEANRRAGAFWALGEETGVPHHSLSLVERLLTLGWIGTVLDVRMPGNRFEPPRDLAETDGWLGDPSTGDVSPWASYPGDRASASWLPSQVGAERWQDFVDIQRAPGPGGGYSDVSGIYDLTAVITDSHGWGMEGTLLTSVLTIRHSTNRPRFGGTFESVLWTYTDGSSAEERPGGVSGSIDTGGRVVMQLLVEGNQYGSNYEGTLTDGRLEGTFQSGELFGTFAAERRPVQ